MVGIIIRVLIWELLWSSFQKWGREDKPPKTRTINTKKKGVKYIDTYGNEIENPESGE